MKSLLLLKRLGIFLFLTSLLTYAQLQPVQNIPINGTSYVYGSSTYVAWYFNGYEAGLTVELQVSVHSDMSSPFVDVTGLTGLTYNVTGLTAGTTYYWRVRSKSSGGSYSAWTSPWSFTVSGTGGGGGTALVPQLNIPLNGSTVTSTSTTLAWYLNGSHAGHTYHVQVSTSSSFGSFFVKDSGLTSLTYALSGLTDGTTYYWRVRSKNSGVKSAWSTTYSFDVDLSGGGGGTPSPPIHYSPADNTTDFSYHPTLVWKSVSGAQSYSLQVSTDSTFATVDRSYSGLADTSKHIHWPKATEYLELDTEYFWRVRVTTLSGTSAWSSHWSFTTKDTPDTPTQLSPADGFTSTYTGIELVWSDVIKVDSYDVEIYADTNAAVTATASVTDTSYYFNGSASTQYWWRVSATESGNQSAFSGFWSFTTGTNTIWYVETAGNGGSNANTGYDPSSPFLTIQFAIDAASAGDKIVVGEGTFTEDLDIQKDDLEIYGTGYSATTTIKGVATEPVGSFPLATPNINIEADGVKIHDFLIESPDLTNDIYSSSIVLTGENIEIYNNKFLTVSTSDDAFAEGDGYSVVIQSYSNGVYPGSDVSGLKIYDNVFTWEEYAPAGGGVGAYEGIWINPHDASGSGIEITGNSFDGNVRRAIAVQTGDALVDDNTIDTDVFLNRGIWILVGSDHTVTNNEISGFTTGIELGATWAGSLGDDIVVTDNDIYDNQFGVIVSDDFSVSTPTVPPVINNNNIYENGINLDASSAVGAAGYFILDAENNYWGSVDGPVDGTYYDTGTDAGTSSELPAGSAALVKTYVNVVAENTGTLGFQVKDNSTADAGAGGFFVDYYPWLGGTPTLAIESTSSTTGATVTLDVSADLFDEEIEYTLVGKFVYDDTKLDFTTGTVGSGTLLNTNGWSAVFYETTSGTVEFIAYGFTDLTGSGDLFSLSFLISAGSAGSTSVTGSNIDFLADGTNIFGTSGSFSGVVTYTHTPGPSTVKGDADLDGDVDFDDVTVMAQHVAGSSTLTGQAFTNADVDSDTDVDSDDIAAVVDYIINGSWSTAAPVVVTSNTMTFDQATEDQVGQIHLPFNLDASTTSSKVRSLELTIVYDEEELDYQSFKGALEGHENYVLGSKVSDGIARFLFASADGIDTREEIGKFILKKGTIETKSEITSVYKLNGGEPQVGPSYKFDGVTGIEEDESKPLEFELTQNYPNPFNPATQISYAIPEASFVTIKIYNMLGQEVKSLIQKEMNTGRYTVTWNGQNEFGQKVASGTYIYRIVAGDFVQAKKMILLK